ncbi:MAG: nucleotide sugar dehydrogenase [Gammaproteobacteria bacterium]
MENKIAIIGLGYVGFPLYFEMSKQLDVLGFDLSEKRVNDLMQGVDSTGEIDSVHLHELISNQELRISSEPNILDGADIYIVTVPTPVDNYNVPDLTPLKSAMELIAVYLKKEDIVVIESTVFPGVTEEICAPILEHHSGLAFNEDFFMGYSPERINPGDKEHHLTKVIKVVSGSNENALSKISNLYNSFVSAGVFEAKDIRTAEAAKVIENAQRDVNIAFMNELSILFEKMGLNVAEVLAAAETKWNFMPFKPGLVGGHCIGVDPYYLTYKANELGYHPQIIDAGRRINDSMPKFYAYDFIKKLSNSGQLTNSLNLLILGITFKENCPDIRNSKVIDLVKELSEFGVEVDVYDPIANKDLVKEEYNLELIDNKKDIDWSRYSGIFCAVAHNEFKELEIDVSNSVLIYDIKSILNRS